MVYRKYSRPFRVNPPLSVIAGLLLTGKPMKQASHAKVKYKSIPIKIRIGKMLKIKEKKNKQD